MLVNVIERNIIMLELKSPKNDGPKHLLDTTDRIELT